MLHGPQQHEVVCSCSVNTENEERLFKSAANAVKCTNRKPQNMLPTVLKRLKVKRASKMGPIHSIRDQNSRIGSQAADLPEYAGSVFLPERPFAWQAHLKSIAHFLIHGKGAWWTISESGNVPFKMVSLTVAVILLGHMYSMLVHPCYQVSGIRYHYLTWEAISHWLLQGLPQRKQNKTK